jgi:hypothetical protein
LTPAPTSPAAPHQTPGGRIPSAQQQALERYNLLRSRIIVDTSLEGTRQEKAPAEIAAAGSNADSESKTALIAIRAKDYDQANKQLQSAEDDLAIVEHYLKP